MWLLFCLDVAFPWLPVHTNASLHGTTHFTLFYALADNLQYRLYDNMQRVKTLRTVTDVLVLCMLF